LQLSADAAPTIAVPTDTICAGTAIPAFTASVPAGLTVIWYDAATGGTVLLANSLSFTPTMAGTYFAEAFDPVTGCRSATRTQATLTINPDPNAELHAGASRSARAEHSAFRQQPTTALREAWLPADQQHGNNDLHLHAERCFAPLRRDCHHDRAGGRTAHTDDWNSDLRVGFADVFGQFHGYGRHGFRHSGHDFGQAL
jgi:hypothetical protein